MGYASIIYQNAIFIQYIRWLLQKCLCISNRNANWWLLDKFYCFYNVEVENHWKKGQETKHVWNTLIFHVNMLKLISYNTNKTVFYSSNYFSPLKLNLFLDIRPPDKSAYHKIIFLISKPKRWDSSFEHP